MAKTGHLSGLVVMAAAAVAASLLMLVATGKPVQASFPGPNGLIAFVSDRAGNDEIYLMNSDGSNQKRLTTDPAIDQYPAVSPDEKKIAFTSGRNGNNEIYVMNADGSGQTNLTKNAADDFGPTWLPPAPSDPSGQNRIVFASNRDGNYEIYVMNADGSGTPTNLTKTSTCVEQLPVASPDGKKIAFQAPQNSAGGCSSGRPDIWIMNTDGSERKALTTNLTANDAYPEFSPNGDEIAFASNRDPNGGPGTTSNNFFDIWVMKAEPESDANPPRNLTHDPNMNHLRPAWSPDAKRIAFWSGNLPASSPFLGQTDDIRGAQSDLNSALYVMNADGSGTPTNLTDPGDSWGEIMPDWAPDTTKPEITLRTPAEGDTYTLNQSVTADYECADEGGSGLASCVGDVPDGASIDTSSVGDKTFTVTAKDNGGNTNSVTHNYRVVYDFKGFFDPVDNPPTLNSAKAGSAIPVKFSLSGDQGLNVLAEGYPKSQEISCDSAAQVNGVEETATATESGLTYDASTDEYTYVWKTDKAWAGTCRQLVVKLKDGTEYKANFKLR